MTPFSAHFISDHRIFDQKVRTVTVKSIAGLGLGFGLELGLGLGLEVRWSEMQWTEK